MQINSLMQGAGVFDSLSSVNSNTNTSDSTSQGTSFLDTLNEKLGEVNDKQITADQTTQAFIQGGNVDVSQMMVASEEAKQSLDMAVQVRNKLLDAYQEINKLQL